MTCGIYLLKFNNTHKVYVGQSLNIEDRYLSHIRNMRNGNTSEKLLSAYNTFGIPYYETLLECTPEELNTNENEAIQVYNSVVDGFNTLTYAEEMPKHKNQLVGEQGPSAVYTNETILNAAILMCDPTNSLVSISQATGVKYATIRKISQGVQHTWIQQEYPEIWDKILSSKNSRNSINNTNRSALLKDKFCAEAQGIVYPKVKSPENTEYTITNLSEFCRVHSLERPNLRKVLNGARHSHKGWTLV